MRNLAIILLISLFATNTYSAKKNYNDIILKANKAYTANDFVGAIDLYKSVVDDGRFSPELYYNLGNSYFKTSNFPLAILYYEKAIKLKPNYYDAEFNLKIANTKIVDKVEVIPELFYQRWWKALYNYTSFDNWAIVAIIFLFIFLVTLSVYMFSKLVLIKKITFGLGLLTLLLTILFFFFAQIQYTNYTESQSAIITAPTLTVKSSPAENSTDLFVIHEGLKVNITNNVSEWLEIRLPNGNVGWVKQNTLERI